MVLGIERTGQREDQPERILNRGGEGAISTKWELSVAKFEMCSNVSWLYRGAAFRNAEFSSPSPKKCREWTFLICRIASCLGTKRGLMRSDSCLGSCCYNERDAARVCADLKLLLLRCDLQKSVFDGWMA